MELFPGKKCPDPDDAAFSIVKIPEALARCGLWSVHEDVVSSKVSRWIGYELHENEC